MEGYTLTRQSYRRPASLWRKGISINEVTGMSNDKLESSLQQVSGVIKMMVGVSNNMCYWALLDTIDELKKTKRYKHQAKKAINNVLIAWKEYERNLITPPEYSPHFFSLKDMPSETRKKYGDITDAEYYSYWSASGAEAYVKAKNEIGCLRHKYYKSLEQHGIKDSEALSWVLTTATLLGAAVRIYKDTISCITVCGFPKDVLTNLFKTFSLEHVKDSYNKAMLLVAPDTDYNNTKEENRDIELGIHYLIEKITDVDYIYSSNIDAAKQYEEIFSSKKEYEKFQRLLAETSQELKKS